MNCKTAQERMNLMLQRKLSEEEACELRDHLSGCSRCLPALKESDLVEVLPVIDPGIEPSGDFHDRFLLRLRNHRAMAAAMEKRDSPWTGFWRRPWIHKLVAAGALAAVLGFGIYVGLQKPEEPVAGPVMMGEINVAENLPLLRDMRVIENLDLLEDFDAIQNLAEGKDATSVH